MAITSEQLLAQVNDLLRTMPEVGAMIGISSSTSEWLGRAAAVLNAWDPITATVQADLFINKIHTNSSGAVAAGHRGLSTLLNRAKYDLGLNTGHLAVAIEHGKVFDYFDQVRKIIETAQYDILFVDPYLDAEFISRYMPHIKKSVTVRLLGKDKITALNSAAKLFQQQEGLKIVVRSSPNHHDRFIFVDAQTCYQSGGSFKDGANKPTILIPITDVFANISSVYEDMWDKGTPAP